MSHSITISDTIWEWAQKQSGRKQPATYLRDILLRAMVSESIAKEINVTNGEDEEIPPVKSRTPSFAEMMIRTANNTTEITHRRKAALDLLDDELFGDPEFVEAWNWFVEKAGGNEDFILTALENKARNGLENPRLFVLKRYRERA
jgi:hypothetical protein